MTDTDITAKPQPGFPLRTVAGVVLLAAMAYGGYWLWLADRLTQRVEDWAVRQTARGWTISHGVPVIAGFPWRAVVRLGEVKISAPFGEWQAENLSVSVGPFGPGRLRLFDRGSNRIVLAGQRWDVSAAYIRTDLSFARDGADPAVRSFQVTAGEAKVTPEGGPTVTADGFGLSVLPQVGGQTSASFVATAAGLGLPIAGTAPIMLFEARGQVMGAIGADLPTTSLAEWSGKGGVIEVTHMVVDWPPVGLEGDGTVALDDALQPLAAFAVQFRGLGPLIDGLERQGALAPAQAAQMRANFAEVPKPDGRGHLVQAVPVTAQNGSLWLGPVAVAAIPKIVWPGKIIRP